jgi:hypothetical protein
MSRKVPGPRNALAGLGLAAAGMVYRRLSGRRGAASPPAAEAQPEESGSAGDATVARARSELAEELARRAARPDA